MCDQELKKKYFNIFKNKTLQKKYLAWEQIVKF
jgi:hypothetical protein